MNGRKTSWKGFFAPVFASLLLGFASCTPESNETVDEEVLSLSETELVFANAGGQKDVTVGGAETWNFISSEGEQGWVKLSKNGNALSVTVEPNPDGTERNASVLVIGRDTQAKFTVKQSAADFVLDFSEAEVVFPTNGGDKVIVVSANSDDWSFDPIPEEIDWLTIKSAGQMVTITALPNTTTEAREASLTVSSTIGEKRELIVKQAGVAKYFLAYVPAKDQPYRPADLIKYEQAQGNVLTAYSSPLPEWGLTGSISFITSSDITPFIEYSFMSDGQPLYDSCLIPIVYADKEAPVEKQEYRDFIKAAGFTATNSGETEFLNAEQTLKVTLDETSYTDGMMATFERNVVQDKPYPTFETMPVGPNGGLEMLNDFSKKVADVSALETSIGAIMVEENLDEADETVIANQIYETGKTGPLNDAAHCWWYWITTDEGVTPEMIGTPTELDLFFDGISAAYWMDGENPVMTNEFKALLDKEGFTFITSQNGSDYYSRPYDAGRDLAIAIAPVKYTNILDGTQCLMIAQFFMASETSGASLRANIDQLFKSRDFKNAHYILSSQSAKAAINHRAKRTF